MVSDIALLKELPAKVRKSIPAYVGCVGGASMKDEYLATMEAAGFKDVDVVKEVSAKAIYGGTDAQYCGTDLGISSETIQELAGSIVSMQVRAIKPD
jgi:hypothetical protein